MNPCGSVERQPGIAMLRRATWRVALRSALSLQCFVMAGAATHTAGASFAMSTQPSAAGAASGPASTAPAVSRGEIEALVRQLGDADFERREQAAARLTNFGDEALDVLLEHLNDSDREVVARIESIIAAPDDPQRCLRTALRLLDTGRPDLTEKAVNMLFARGAEMLEPFRRAAATARGNLAVVAPSILEELNLWVRHEAATLPRMGAMPPRKRATQMRLLEEVRVGRARAAYLLAVADLSERHGGPPPEDADSKR